MRILFLDNAVERHLDHQKIIDRFNKHKFNLKADCTTDELLSSKYNIIIVHKGNTKEYNCTLENKLGTHRIFFSGAERNPRKTEKGIFASTDTIEDDLSELLDK